MARQFVLVALVFFAVVGLAFAVPAAEPPKAGAAANNSDVGDLLAPGADNAVGNTDGAAAPGAAADAAVEAPIGGPGAAGAGSGPAEAPKSAASAVEVSAASALAAVAGFIFF